MYQRLKFWKMIEKNRNLFILRPYLHVVAIESMVAQIACPIRFSSRALVRRPRCSATTNFSVLQAMAKILWNCKIFSHDYFFFGINMVTPSFKTFFFEVSPMLVTGWYGLLVADAALLHPVPGNTASKPLVKLKKTKLTISEGLKKQPIQENWSGLMSNENSMFPKVPRRYVVPLTNLKHEYMEPCLYRKPSTETKV